MNKQEYKEYQNRVEQFFEQENLKWIELKPEDYYIPFSKSACECCNSPLHGERYIHMAQPDKVTYNVSYELCVDCTYYLQYDKLENIK